MAVNRLACTREIVAKLKFGVTNWMDVFKRAIPLFNNVDFANQP